MNPNYRRRWQAIEKYLANPKRCKLCGEPMVFDAEEFFNDKKKTIRTFKRRLFCNSSCAAKYNNRSKVKEGSVTDCLYCGNLFHKAYKTQKFCNRTCCGKYAKEVKFSFIEGLTKGQIKERYSPQTARSTITRHANKVFDVSGRDRVCEICGYDKAINICHIKPVKDFEDEDYLIDINSIDNLKALCPNCHWDFDHPK